MESCEVVALGIAECCEMDALWDFEFLNIVVFRR